MAIKITSGNLNSYGDSGNFESDASTWGFSNVGTQYSIQRSSDISTKGTYSLRAHFSAATNAGTQTLLALCRNLNADVSKKYVARVKVYVPAPDPVAADNVVLSLKIDAFIGTTYNLVDKTVGDCKERWQQLEWYFSPVSSGTNIVLLTLKGQSIAGGTIYVDEFELFEYIDSGSGGDPEDPEDPDEGEPRPFSKTYFSRDPIRFPVSASSGWQSKPNYRLYTEIRVEDKAGTGVFNSKIKMELEPESDGTARFNLRQAFQGDVLKAAPPTKLDKIARKLTDRVKYFKPYTGEMSGTDLAPFSVFEGDTFQVILGGLDKKAFPSLDFFNKYLPEKKAFLTWCPPAKVVDRYQEEYLSFYVYTSSIKSFKVITKMIYSDLSTQTTPVLAWTSSLAYGDLIQIPIGPSHSGILSFNPEKVLISYDVWLSDQDGNNVSEVRSYIIRQTVHPQTRYFLFLNSLGGYDTLRIQGKAQVTTSLQKTIIQKHLPMDYNALDGELEVNESYRQQITDHSTGFITGAYAKEYKEYLQDFLLSPRVFDITNGDRVPVIVESGDIVLSNEEDEKYMHYIRFRVQEAYINNSFTPQTL